MHKAAAFVFDPPPRPEAQADGQRICTNSSARDLFDLSAYNTSGGLPAENLGSYLISQGETCSDRGKKESRKTRLKVETGILKETAAEEKKMK